MPDKINFMDIEEHFAMPLNGGVVVFPTRRHTSHSPEQCRPPQFAQPRRSLVTSALSFYS
jgi:hypothetical protein